MILPHDPLREAILLELNWAICARRARGVSFDALEREYGLSKEVLYLIARHNDRDLEQCELGRCSEATPDRER
jgi:hypothetical protein